MRIEPHERTVEVWEHAITQINTRIQGNVLCISTNELTRRELALVEGNAYFVSTLAEVPEASNFSYSSTIIFASGLDLASKLLNSKCLDVTGRIHWHLETGLLETLDILEQLPLPSDVRVEIITDTDAGVVVTTALTTGGVLDAHSYLRGVEAGLAGSQTGTHPGQAPKDVRDQRETRTLQEKLLRTLQTIEPLIDNTPNCDRLHDERAEGELVILRRKYEDLERKYKILANSRLGKLTLKIWARKRRPSAPQSVQ